MASGLHFAVPALSASRSCSPPRQRSRQRSTCPSPSSRLRYPENLEWNPTGFENLLAEGIAVSDKNGHIYVADSGRGVIFDFSSTTDKAGDRWDGSTTPIGSFGGSRVSVAVDNGTGDVYVADRNHGVIDKFDENGNLITSFGDSEPTHNGQLAGLETPAGSFAPPTDTTAASRSRSTRRPTTSTSSMRATKSSTSSMKAVPTSNRSPPRRRGFTKKCPARPRTTGIAVTTAGDVYVADWAAHEIFQFNAAGEYVSAWNGGTLPNGAASETPEGNFGPEYEPLEVAAEDSTGNVFVNNPSNGSIDVFDKNGNYLYQASHAELGGEWIYFPQVVALDQATGYLYSARFSSSAQVLKPIIVPDVSVGATSDVGTTTATFHGHVDPASGEGGGPVTGCRFEYIATFDAATNPEIETFKGAKSVPCAPAIPPDYSRANRRQRQRHRIDPRHRIPVPSRGRQFRRRKHRRRRELRDRRAVQPLDPVRIDRIGRRPARRTAGRGDRRSDRRRLCRRRREPPGR